MSNQKNNITISILHRSFKGLCKCGAAFSSTAPWLIDPKTRSARIELERGLEDLAHGQCDQCSTQHKGPAPVIIHCSKEERAYIAIPESLSYMALSLQGELLTLLSTEAQVKAASYFHQAELIIGTQSLRDRLIELSASYDFKMATSATPLPKAPKISELPQGLKSKNDIEQQELLQELAESQTQVIRDQSGASQLNTEVSQSKSMSGLDALIDSALDQSHSAPAPRAPAKLIETTQEFHIQEPKSLANSPAKESRETVVTDHAPIQHLEEVSVRSKEPTKLLYAQNMKQFDHELAKGSTRYMSVVDGTVELSHKIDEKRAESWISDELDVRIQLHRELQLGAPCLTLFTLKDGTPQDELYWPIHIDNMTGPKVLRSLRQGFKFELTLYKKNGKFYGQRVIEAPLEENSAYIINYVKQMGMTSSNAAKVRSVISAEDFDRDGQMRHPFNQSSFSEINSAKEAMMAVGIWSYWSTVRQRDYLIFIKSFPIPWLRRLQHRVLKSAIEFGIHMPPNLQGQAVALGLAKSDVELIQKCITHFVEVNVNFRTSDLSPLETWENWDALLAQLSEMGIDTDEEVEQLAFQAMQRAGVDFDEEEPTNSQDYESLESIEFSGAEITEVKSISSAHDSLADDSFEDLSDISEIREIGDDVPPPIDQVMSDDAEEIELISEDFIEEEYLTDAGGDAFLLIDDADIIDEDVVDPVTAAVGDQIKQLNRDEAAKMSTQVFVSPPKEA